MNPTEVFKHTLNEEMRTFGLTLDPEVQQNLGNYFDLLTRWNSRLHLVAPCSPEEFAKRHVLESLVLLSFLPAQALIADIGSGGGLPLIPCLIARHDIEGWLIESSKRKGVFLNEAVNRLGLATRARVMVQRFDQVVISQANVVTCRALEQLIEQTPAILNWAPKDSSLLLFGGESLGQALSAAGAKFEKVLMQLSDRRFLFISKCPTSFSLSMSTHSLPPS